MLSLLSQLRPQPLPGDSAGGPVTPGRGQAALRAAGGCEPGKALGTITADTAGRDKIHRICDPSAELQLLSWSWSLSTAQTPPWEAYTDPGETLTQDRHSPGTHRDPAHTHTSAAALSFIAHEAARGRQGCADLAGSQPGAAAGSRLHRPPDTRTCRVCCPHIQGGAEVTSR